VILGESFSGPIAVRLASKPEGELLGIVLVASFVTPPALRLWRHLPWRLLFRSPWFRWWSKGILSGSATELAQRIHEAIRLVPSDTLAARVRSILSIDVRAELAATTCPMLYIQAGRDLVVPRRCLRVVISVRPDVVVERLDTRHCVLQLTPVASWAILEHFVRRIQRA